jgi:DNA mismatch repair protein MutS
MSFISIIFNEPTESTQDLPSEQPEHFLDLNLNQIVDEVTLGWQEYELKPFFYFPLKDLNAIEYRHNVFQDLENETFYKHVNLFADRMREVRKHLSSVEKFYYTEQKEIWFLYATEIYCDAIKNFIQALSYSSIKSQGFLKIKDYLTNYSLSKDFTTLTDEMSKIKTDLDNVKYRIIIEENSFTVQNFEPGIDYSNEIEKTFEKFSQGTVKDYKTEYKSAPAEVNHIEVKILKFVSYLYPDLFLRLKNFKIDYANFMDGTISAYDREIHFYISYIEHIKKFKQNNLKFCYPYIVNKTKEICSYEGFDLALAQKLTRENLQIICNDFFLKDKERIIVVTGPNQGGKTTFARTFGQLHYLASLGCPVPGCKAQLYLADIIFTQFEKVEKVENLRGKLEDDLKRIHSAMRNATSQSIIVMNEIFNSTALRDMTFLSTKILEKITELDAICVWVTFVDELASFNEKTVSMTSMIVPENSALRTFRIIRRPADGLAYAMAVAEKYRLRYEHIKERIKK